MSRRPTAAPPRRRKFHHDEDLFAPSGLVAIVGRPNVGKSTLFNRLTGERQAIVDEMAGLTRDRLYGVTEWIGRRFTVIDTAGLDPGLVADDPGITVLTRGTQSQTRVAIDEADLCVFMVDVRAGVTGLDEDIAAMLRQGGKPTILVGNKADSAADPYLGHELYRLGLGEPIRISALQGKDTGDLLDQVVQMLPPPLSEPPTARDELRLAIIGRPNVGKSSLLNALAGEERALVSPVAGTTRDTVDTVLEHPGVGRVRIIDTAGIRRRGVVDTPVEHYSLLRSLRAMERCDVALVMVDADDGVVAQDRHIGGYAAEAGKGVVVLANKWDLVAEELRSQPSFLKAFGEAFSFVPGVPVLTLSATEGRHVNKVVEQASLVARARSVRIPTAALNAVLRAAVDEHPPRFHKGKRLKVMYAAQASTPNPTIVIFVNDPDLMHFAYARYLENRIRSVFGFAGTRLRLVCRHRGEAG